MRLPWFIFLDPLMLFVYDGSIETDVRIRLKAQTAQVAVKDL